MSLINSPVESVEIADLGVRVDHHPDLPKKAITRSNTNIYFSCLLGLIQGRRDLLPILWAWSKAAGENSLARWKPEAEETHTDVLWAVEFCTRLMDICIDYRIPAIIPVVYGQEDDTVNVPHIVARVASAGLKYVTAFREEDNQDAGFQYIMGKIGISERDQKVLQWIATQCMVGSLIGAAGYKAHSERIEKGNDEIASQIIQGAASSVEAMLGNKFIFLPSKALDAYDRMGDPDESTDMEEVWKACVDAMFNDYDKDMVVPIIDYADPHERSMRWLNGDIGKELAEVRNRVANVSWEQACSEAYTTMSHAIPKPDFNITVQRAAQTVDERMRNNLYLPVTFMSAEKFREFRSTGVMPDPTVVSEDSWLSRFSDDFAHSMRLTDVRLWGERARDMTYAVLIRMGDQAERERLANMFGDVMVTWRPEVLGYSTLTCGESFQNHFALPADRQTIRKALCLQVLAEMGVGTAKFPGPISPLAMSAMGANVFPNVIELQIHDRLSFDRMKSYTSATDGIGTSQDSD